MKGLFWGRGGRGSVGGILWGDENPTALLAKAANLILVQNGSKDLDNSHNLPKDNALS